MYIVLPTSYISYWRCSVTVSLRIQPWSGCIRRLVFSDIRPEETEMYKYLSRKKKSFGRSEMHFLYNCLNTTVLTLACWLKRENKFFRIQFFKSVSLTSWEYSPEVYLMKKLWEKQRFNLHLLQFFPANSQWKTS